MLGLTGYMYFGLMLGLTGYMYFWLNAGIDGRARRAEWCAIQQTHQPINQQTQQPCYRILPRVSPSKKTQFGCKPVCSAWVLDNKKYEIQGGMPAFFCRTCFGTSAAVLRESGLRYCWCFWGIFSMIFLSCIKQGPLSRFFHCVECMLCSFRRFWGSFLGGSTWDWLLSVFFVLLEASFLFWVIWVPEWTQG